MCITFIKIKIFLKVLDFFSTFNALQFSLHFVHIILKTADLELSDLYCSSNTLRVIKSIR